MGTKIKQHLANKITLLFCCLEFSDVLYVASDVCFFASDVCCSGVKLFRCLLLPTFVLLVLFFSDVCRSDVRQCTATEFEAEFDIHFPIP